MSAFIDFFYPCRKFSVEFTAGFLNGCKRPTNPKRAVDAPNKGIEMLYIGNFSFDEIDVDDNQRHGHLSSIVSAESPDEAVLKFREHFSSLKNHFPAMLGVVTVYIEEILQINKSPETPVVTRLQFSEGAFSASVSHSLPSANYPHVIVFDQIQSSENQEWFEYNKHLESEPFIIL
jgi:hypothetical protein